jgi:hypothetical protein
MLLKRIPIHVAKFDLHLVFHKSIDLEETMELLDSCFFKSSN